MKSPDEVTLDLYRHSARGIALNLLAVNQNLREIMRNHYILSNRMILMTTKEAIGVFSGWKCLKSLQEGPLFAIFPTSKEFLATKGSEPAATIELNFDLTWSATLGDVRIDTFEFIRLTYILRPYSVLRFNLTRPARQGLTSEVYTTTLASFRKDFFIFISSIMSEAPTSADLDCPEVWIDGCGHIIWATYPSTDKGVKKHWPRIPSEHNSILSGDEYARSLEIESHEVESLEKESCSSLCLRRVRTHNNALNESESLCAMWTSLRDLDRPEEESCFAWPPMSF